MRGKKVKVMAVLLGWVLFVAAGCGDDVDGSPKADAGKSSDAGGDAGSDDGTAQDTGVVEGIVYRQGEVDHSGVTVSLDGTDQDTVTEETGDYRFKNVDADTYTVTASLDGYAEQTSSPFEVRAGETIKVDPLTLIKTTGELSGTVLLEGQDDHSGAVITVEGTSYTAVTDENGNWSISEVATGQYRIEATHSRYESRVASDISVLAGQVTTVRTMSLVCPTGFFIVDGVCCDKACYGACESCRIPGSLGTCIAHASGTDPDSECTLGIGCDAVCDGNGGSGEGACLVSSCEGRLPYRPVSARGGYTDNGDGTVTDEITGLMWMRCTFGQTWSNEPTCDGYPDSKSWQDAFATCDTLDFAGYDDWGLPDIHELISIVDYREFNPAIEAEAFPGTISLSCWSSSSYAGNQYYAWYLNPYNGYVDYLDKDNGRYVRCVRFGPLDLGTFESFTLSGDRVVSNSATGLMWQDCPAGQSGADCSEGERITIDWQHAKDYCAGLSWAGFDDWRLPGVTELTTIVDYTRSATAIDTTIFPGTRNAYFLSSSPSANDQGLAWGVDFDNGRVDIVVKDGGYDVRCVRLGP